MSAVRVVLSLTVACALSLAGCKKDQSATGQPAAATMGSYAEGYNELTDRIKEVISSYERAFPDGPEAAFKARIKPHLFTVPMLSRSLAKAKASFDQAKASAPESMALLGKQADALLAAAEPVAALWGEVNKYYDAETYKDDQFAKGNELHAKMTAAIRTYRTAVAALSTSLDKIEDEQAVSELKKYESEKGYSYWFRKFTMDAKKFVSAAQAIDHPEQLPSLAAAWEPLAATHAELAKFVASKGPSINQSFGAYAGAAERFDTTGQKLVRAAKQATDADEKTATDAVETAQRELESLVSAYNSLVSIGNSLYKVEDVDALK